MQLRALSILVAFQFILPISALAQMTGGASPGGASGGAGAGGQGNVSGGFPGGTATQGAVNSTGFTQPTSFSNNNPFTFSGGNNTGSFNSGNIAPPNTQNSPFAVGPGQNMIGPNGLFNGTNMIPSSFRMPGVLGGSVFNSGAQFGALTTGGGLGFFGSGGGGFFGDLGMGASPLMIPGMQVNATMLREGGLLGSLGTKVRMKDKGRTSGGLDGNVREYGTRGTLARANARLNLIADSAVAGALGPQRAVIGARGLVNTEESVRGTIIRSIVEPSCGNGCLNEFHIVSPGDVIWQR
jgi:hypothetical protein